MGEVVSTWFQPAENLSEEQKQKMLNLRSEFMDIAEAVELNCPSGRRKSIVLTKLEEAAMMATKAITHG